MSSTRGIRNNNPGNIDRSPNNKWQGRMARERMTAEQRAEKRFEVFASPAWGIRAMCVLLINYFDRHNRDTVRKIINRWAPPVENDTGAYVAQVAKAMGVDPDGFVNLHEYRRLRPMVEAIIRHENGRQPYSAEVIEEGLRLAGVVRPDAARLVAAPRAATLATATALTAGGTAAVIEGLGGVLPSIADGLGQALPALQAAAQVVHAVSALPTWLRAVAVTAVALSIGANLYAWWKLRQAQRAVQP